MEKRRGSRDREEWKHERKEKPSSRHTQIAISCFRVPEMGTQRGEKKIRPGQPRIRGRTKPLNPLGADDQFKTGAD